MTRHAHSTAALRRPLGAGPRAVRLWSAGRLRRRLRGRLRGRAQRPAARRRSRPTTHGHAADAAPGKHTPLRAGERRVTVRMPKAYTPSAPTGIGTDDYRCFLLDPKVPSDQFITGFNVLPGNPDVVHHVILFRVPADLVAQAEQKDAGTPGQGWTCFGASGLGRGPGGIDDAPWVGAWAPGGSEQVYGAGFGEELGKGSRVVMQVHYNLLAGRQPGPQRGRAAARPGLGRHQAARDPAAAGAGRDAVPPRAQRRRALQPSRGARGRQEALRRGPGSTADLLHFLCGEIKAGAGPVVHPDGHPAGDGPRRRRTHAPAGPLDQDRGEPRRARCPHPARHPGLGLRQPGAAGRSSPRSLEPGDTLKVTCRHEQSLRDQLPSFEGQPDKYVLWGDGTTDEMCLGIMLVTRP